MSTPPPMSRTPLLTVADDPTGVCDALRLKRASPPPVARYGEMGKLGANLSRTPGVRNSDEYVPAEVKAEAGTVEFSVPATGTSKYSARNGTDNRRKPAFPSMAKALPLLTELLTG